MAAMMTDIATESDYRPHFPPNRTQTPFHSSSIAVIMLSSGRCDTLRQANLSTARISVGSMTQNLFYSRDLTPYMVLDPKDPH